MITTRGGLLLGVSLALCVGGVLTQDGPLMTVGSAGLLVLLVAWVIGYFSLRSLSASISLPARISADMPFDLCLWLENHGWLFPNAHIQGQLQLGPSTRIRITGQWISPGEQQEIKKRGTIALRGKLTEHRLKLSSTWPLRLTEHRCSMPLNAPILIHPRAITPREFTETGDMDLAWNGFGMEAGDAPGELRGIRPYRPGDPAKRLHWPSTIRSQARGRSPRVLETDPPGLRPERVKVIFHSFGTDSALIRTDHFERSLSLLHGTLRHLRALGIPTTVAADFARWTETRLSAPAAWRELLETLARAERAHDTEAHDLEHVFQKIPPGSFLIILSDMPPEGWQNLIPPQQDHLIIDVRQHRYGKRRLSIGKAILPSFQVATG